MSDFTSFEAQTSVAELTLSAKVSIKTPILRRVLMTEVAAALEQGWDFVPTSNSFLATVANRITEHGANSFSHLPKPNCAGISGGLDRLLVKTAALWGHMFGDDTATEHTIVIQWSLSPEDIIHAYACALSIGFIDPKEDPPEEADAYRVLHFVIDAYIHYGERYSDLGHSSDIEISEVTVKRALPHLFSDYSCGTGFSVECLEF